MIFRCYKKLLFILCISCHLCNFLVTVGCDSMLSGVSYVARVCSYYSLCSVYRLYSLNTRPLRAKNGERESERVRF